MDELSVFDVVLALIVGGLFVAQRRFHSHVAAQLSSTKEIVEDLGWNWERDETYTSG